MNGINSNITQTAGVFTGAYAKRQQEAHKTGLSISKDQSETLEKSINAAANSINQSGEGVKLSISKEDMDFLASEEGFKKMQQDTMDLYALNVKQQEKLAEGRDPSDKFWNNTGDQWLTFSEELDKAGFYDNMSDEQVKEFEGLLEQITSGMDRLSKSQYNTGIDFGSLSDSGSKFFMSSAEASVALETSTAALKYMSEKLIPDELKEDFNKLIDMYKKHNEEILSEYNNPMESFNRVVANINKMGSSKIAEKPVGEYKYTVMLGSIDKSEEEKKDFREQIADIFQKYGLKGDFTTTLDMIKKQFEDYASGNSEDKGFRQYVNDEAARLFDDMQKYWVSLMAHVNGHS